jgi:hypothetical protein
MVVVLALLSLFVLGHVKGRRGWTVEFQGIEVCVEVVHLVLVVVSFLP